MIRVSSRDILPDESVVLSLHDADEHAELSSHPAALHHHHHHYKNSAGTFLAVRRTLNSLSSSVRVKGEEALIESLMETLDLNTEMNEDDSVDAEDNKGNSATTFNEVISNVDASVFSLSSHQHVSAEYGEYQRFVHEIDSDLFKGKITFAIAGISPPRWFEGKARVFQVVMQGSFKKSISFADVYCGQAWESKLAVAPPSMLMKIVTPLMHMLQPGMHCNLEGDHPFVLSPLMSTMQAIVISTKGTEPPLLAPDGSIEEMKENLSILGPEFCGMSAAARKAFFSDEKNLEKFSFDPELVYSFDFYEHLLRMDNFRLKLGMLSYDLTHFLGSLPVMHLAVLWNPKGEKDPQECPHVFGFEFRLEKEDTN